MPATEPSPGSVDPLPAQQGGAKALLLTVLGEFVLPAGGSVWTTTLVSAADVLGITEKNARQAVARIADQGLIEPTRHGRRVRWSLTGDGRGLLESGAARIYSFGTSTVGWDRTWLLAHCPVPEAQRALRHQLRTRLAFLGFGELSASLAVSPHVDREPALRRVLGELDLAGDSVVVTSTTASTDDDAGLVARAWELDRLGADYEAFIDRASAARPDCDESSFRSLVELVHDWRRFPFIDPELPTELLPDRWVGSIAVTRFHDLHTDWSSAANTWFERFESPDQRLAV
jgi:phenylacetic acid degradation operon negative regulatory protein